MVRFDLVEIIGILAGLLVLGSFLFKDQVKIRIVNAVGSVIFVVYGILITSYATIFLNSVMIVVQIHYLCKGGKKR